MRRYALARGINLESRGKLRELEALASTDLHQALAKLSVYRDSDLYQLALAALARGWAKVDPAAAAKWVANLESSNDQVSATLGLVPAWAALHPEDCLDWAGRQAPGNLREVSLVELASTWVSTAPGEALTRFLTLTPEDGTERGLHAIAAQWVLDDPASAIEYVAALDPLKRRDEFLETALVSLTNQDPNLAWRQSTRFDDASRIGHVRSIALEAMAETRPQDALNLAATAGNSPLLLQAVARGWASWDAPAAEAWIGGLTDLALATSLRDSIISHADQSRTESLEE